MEYPITQIWDYRLLYTYSLLGGYFKTGSDSVSMQITTILNTASNKDYLLQALEKLENESKIVVSNVGIGDYDESIKLMNDNYKNRPAEHTSVKFQPIFNPPVPHKLSKLRKQSKRVDSAYIFLELDDIDDAWFRNTVSSYLSVVRANNLFEPMGGKYSLYEQQKHNIEADLGHSDKTKLISGTQSFNKTGFLETVLAMADEGEVEISSMNPTIIASPAEGYSTFRANVKRIDSSTSTSELHNNETSLGRDEGGIPNKWIAEVIMEGTQLYIGIQGRKRVALKRLSAGYAPYQFMEFMYKNPFRTFARDEIVDVIKKDASNVNLVKLVKDCGFDKVLKRIFFDTTSKFETEFKRERAIDIELYEKLENRLLELSKKQQEKASKN